jgi:hypothetical protein
VRRGVQILEVGITEAKTLVGLIDQVFDKALIETTFCELYAELCSIVHSKVRPCLLPPPLPPAQSLRARPAASAVCSSGSLWAPEPACRGPACKRARACGNLAAPVQRAAGEASVALCVAVRETSGTSTVCVAELPGCAAAVQGDYAQEVLVGSPLLRQRSDIKSLGWG